MLESQRAEHVNRLVEGIGIIGPGAIFERFGAKFLDHHLDAGLVHRGLNVQLNPVGGTVDSVDDAGRVAAEYSIEKTYFQAQWTKPTNDILHVLSKHPDIKDIYLLSSQTSTVAEIAAAKARVGAWPGFADRTIHYYDARRIAEVIADDLLLDDAAVRALTEHLPVLERILAEHQATLTVPAVDQDHVPIPQVADAIDGALNEETPVAVISGIAGSGKSRAAAFYAQSRRDRYQTPMWIDGACLAKPADLASTRFWSGGADLNVAGMLSSRVCLLVIDDLPPAVDPAQLASLCGPGSHIVVTRRETGPGDIVMPFLDAASAAQLLNREVEPCPAPVLEAIIRTVGGHPLSLALLNRAVRSGVSWRDVAEDLKDIAEYADGRERLADRILGRLAPFLARELAVFAWLGQSSCDRRFLKSVIRTPGMVKIGGQGLRAADHPMIVRLHDVVYASVRAQDWLRTERAQELDQALDAHLAALAEEESLALRVLANTMRGKLERIATERSSPGVLVALLHLWRADELQRDLVGDPEAHLARLEARGAPASYVEIRLVFEVIEGLYRADKLTSVEDAKVALAARLPLFERLLALEVANPKSLAEIRHHFGKALKLVGEVERAIEEFERVMAGAHPLNATRLQLVRLYARSNERAVDLADEILTEARTPLTVMTSVVLGVIENLSWAKGKALHELFDKHAELIEREITAAADAGLEQAFGALASVSRYWSWHDLERLRRIFGALPMPPVGSVDDNTSGALGESLLKVAKYGSPPDRTMQERALGYFEAIGAPTDFQLQKHGEVLIDLKRFPEAEAVLRRITDLKTNAFAAYRLSQAMLGQGEAGEAIAQIDAALANLRDTGTKYIATFRAHRFKVREAMGDAGAATDLDIAIEACEPGRYRDQLEALREGAAPD